LTPLTQRQNVNSAEAIFDPILTGAVNKDRRKSPNSSALAGVKVNVAQNFNANLDNLRLLDEQTAQDEIALFRRAGGQTVVDPTNVSLSRDPLAGVQHGTVQEGTHGLCVRPHDRDDRRILETFRPDDVRHVARIREWCEQVRNGQLDRRHDGQYERQGEQPSPLRLEKARQPLERAAPRRGNVAPGQPGGQRPDEEEISVVVRRAGEQQAEEQQKSRRADHEEDERRPATGSDDGLLARSRP